MVQVVKRTVFEVPLPIIHSQPISEGRIDVHRLSSDSLLLLFRYVAQGLDVVHSIGEFYQQNSPVFACRYQHLAETLDPLLLTICGVTAPERTAVNRVQFDLFKFRNTVNENGNAVTEFVANVFYFDAAILDGVVKKPCGNQVGGQT